ncbi:Glutathione peroxidase 3 [Merluccius polli]|uniref:Glutathione peroxidase n=1 Tax=Merluccius polli TaxID=89951 RepID=A0AA47N808_MERPO|nr:Glutathione peroxidase 3 [Merluccius polli]
MRQYGFTILGFPSNNFGKQEPGRNDEILPGLKHVRPGKGFVPNFQLFERGDINGANEQPVYTFLKGSCPPVGDSLGEVSGRLFWQPIRLSDVKWNFEKFLVGPTGKPVRRWHAGVEVSVVRKDIVRHLQQIHGQRISN